MSTTRIAVPVDVREQARALKNDLREQTGRAVKLYEAIDQAIRNERRRLSDDKGKATQ